MLLVLENCSLLDAARPELRSGSFVVIEDQEICEVADSRPSLAGAERIDLGGRTLMPGLIDAHAHVTLSEVDVSRLAGTPATLMAARAGKSMREMLDRGFTTVRDTGGADAGLAQAVDEGLLVGPRLFVSGRPMSQTGGHADFRRRTEDSVCGCAGALGFQSRIVDGVAAVQHGVRDELRKGATQIKIMASGGVASQHDPLEGLQFSVEEIRAAVEEATRWGTYVCAHAYGAEAIRRAVDAGVRSIEHGNLVDAPTASLMAERGAFMVPTLVAYDMLAMKGAELGLSAASQEKLKIVLSAGLESLAVAKRAGVRLGFGSDLLGALQWEQSREFRVRSEVQSPFEVIVSATETNAELLNQAGRLGVIAPGALADLIVVDGDPLRDIGLLEAQGRHLAMIMKGGWLYKNELR